MENITSLMVMNSSKEIESFSLTISITQYFAIKFFLDSNVQTACLINSSKWHTEYHINREEFNTLVDKFDKPYGALVKLKSVFCFPNQNKVDEQFENLRFEKHDGVIYLKGCIDERCSGIRLPCYTMQGFRQYKKLCKTAFDTELTHR